jgi:hypothetical protein
MMWLTFLDHDGIDPTNNLAESQLRPAVIARKIFCGSRFRVTGVAIPKSRLDQPPPLKSCKAGTLAYLRSNERLCAAAEPTLEIR